MSSAAVKPSHILFEHPSGLRAFSKILCFSTLFLIFAGGMVTSTESGLAVPDWPLSYGTLFPPMVGGVFYEHGHRMIAALIGLMTLGLCVWINIKEKRRWLRFLSFLALGLVIFQGILGGITVLFFLPTPVSVLHAVTAQTFFITTIFIAYSLSEEHTEKLINSNKVENPGFLKFAILCMALVYLQLILGAVMRHTHSGLAIPDFPQMGGEWLPSFRADMLARINAWRFDHNLDPVDQYQVVIHFAHRFMALVILIAICFLNLLGVKYSSANKKIMKALIVLDIVVLIQILLGVATVLMEKWPIVTTLHVATGAALLGLHVLLVLRIAPVTMDVFKHQLLS